MKYEVGQGILAKLHFKDGTLSKKTRPYLIVGVDITLDGKAILTLLVVSTTKYKSKKANFDSNYKLKNNYPPFILKSFVKLDSSIKVNIQKHTHRVCANGKLLNNEDMQYILDNMYQY